MLGTFLAHAVLRPCTVALQVPSKERVEVERRVNSYLRTASLQGWSDAAVRGAVMDVFKVASKCGDEIVISEAYTKAINRKSFYVLVRFAVRGGQEQLSMAAVQHYLRVQHPQPSRTPHPTLRLAWIQLFVPADPDVVDGMHVARLTGDEITRRYIDIDSIETKLVTGWPADGRRMYGIRYAKTSAMN